MHSAPYQWLTDLTLLVNRRRRAAFLSLTDNDEPATEPPLWCASSGGYASHVFKNILFRYLILCPNLLLPSQPLFMA